MQLLLDTHAFLWWVINDRRLSRAAEEAIADDGNDVLVSAASAWKIATKHRLGKLPDADVIAVDVAGVLASQGFTELPITVDDGARTGALPGPLRDPFDRILIAQASGPQPCPRIQRAALRPVRSAASVVAEAQEREIR